MPDGVTLRLVPVLTHPATLSHVVPGVVSIQYSYEVALLDADHDRACVVARPPIPLVGLVLPNVPGITGALVVKDHHALFAKAFPPANTDLTCQ